MTTQQIRDLITPIPDELIIVGDLKGDTPGSGCVWGQAIKVGLRDEFLDFSFDDFRPVMGVCLIQVNNRPYPELGITQPTPKQRVLAALDLYDAATK